MLRVGKESCPHCDQDEIYVSRPQGLWEELLISRGRPSLGWLFIRAWGNEIHRMKGQSLIQL